MAFFPHFTQEFNREKGFGVDRHKLPIPVVTRYIRFHPTKHIMWDCLRVEVYGIFKGEWTRSKYDKWINRKVLWEVFRSRVLNFRISGRSDKFCLMNLFVYFTHLNSLITGYSDYLSRLSVHVYSFFWKTSSKQLHAFLEKLPASVWHLVEADVTQLKPLFHF